MWQMGGTLCVVRVKAAGLPVSNIVPVMCAEAGDTDLLFSLHSLGAQDLIWWRATDEWGRRGDSMAHIAARRGHSDFIRVLHDLEEYSEMLEGCNGNGWTIAHFALDGAHLALLNTLLCLGYQHLFGACGMLVKQSKERLLTLENAYKNGRLAGDSSIVQVRRRRMKSRLRSIVQACDGLC